MKVAERLSQLKWLACIDNSADYKTDSCIICFDYVGNEYCLITSSGWTGEYDEERFKTLDSLFRCLLTTDRWFQPSQETINILRARCNENAKKL